MLRRIAIGWPFHIDLDEELHGTLLAAPGVETFAVRLAIITANLFRGTFVGFRRSFARGLSVTRRRIDLAAAIQDAEARERRVRELVAGRRARLPLRLWRQQAHFTTPAADAELARKAIEAGTLPMARILERFGVAPSELAATLGLPAARVADLLERPRRAPLVMLDGEDAQALRPDVSERGVKTAVDLLKNADWGSGDDVTLRFFRVPGFALGGTGRDLLTLCDSLAEDAGASPFPLDGIIFPKLEHPEEVDLLYGHLDRAEAELGLPAGSIRVGLLIESGWAVARLPDIVERAVSRLSALILGLVDFSADLLLPQIRNDHPVADWARASVVALAGAAQVPAIDAMTIQYPVADPTLDVRANRARFLDRLRGVYADAVRARTFGMTGKWVGHPAQLFAVLLAFDEAFLPDELEAEAAKVEAYRATVETEARGATIIDGVMSDRATDRHARELLRRAVALGRFPSQRAVALGVIEATELSDAVALERQPRA
jgi:citrate lyase subunit beta / citryl-CoA lyase